MKIKIETDNINTPRWKIDIEDYQLITYHEHEIIEEIAELLESHNQKMDIEREERDNLPFN